MKAAKVSCDAGCGKKFKIKALDCRRVKDDIDLMYFTCPHCHQEYQAYYLSDKIREMQAEQRKILAENRGAKVKEMKSRIKAEMDRVKAEAETGNGKM